MTATPNAGDGTYRLWHSPDATNGDGSADSLVVTFSRPVGMLAILREGTHSCYDTTIGQVVAYGANNVELGRSPFNLIQTCSDALPSLREDPAVVHLRGIPWAASSAPYTSPYAPFAEAELAIPAGVTRLVFLPPEVWDFTFVDPYFPENMQRFTRQGTYSLIFRPEPQSQPELRVTCAPRQVIRGTSISCAAVATVNSPMERVTWQFTSTDSIMPGFSTVDSSAGASWSGDLVLSGIIRARALVQGQELSAADTVVVAARDWSAEATPYTITRVSSLSSDPPGSVSELGLNAANSVVRHESSRLVPTGPNAGLVYFDAIPYRLDFEVSFNETAMSVGSIFYGMQPRTAQILHGTPYCARSRVVSDTVAVKRHEGFSIADENSHSQVMWRAFTAYVRQPAERLVGDERLNPRPLMSLADSVALRETLRVTHGARTNPYQTDCEFNYDPSLRFP